MSIDGKQLLAYAKSVASDSSQPARRASIGRAYYAAFHSLLPAVAEVSGNDATGAHGCLPHGEVGVRLKRWQAQHHDKKLAMAFGVDAFAAQNNFWVLKDNRERADYLLGSDVDAILVRDSLARAENLCKFAHKVLSSKR